MQKKSQKKSLLQRVLEHKFEPDEITWPKLVALKAQIQAERMAEKNASAGVAL